MPNRKYEKGARFERKIVNAARAGGLISARTAGSKSKIDCFIIDPVKKKVEFIQAKKGSSNLTKKQKQEFEDMSDEYLVKFKVVEE